MSTLSSSEAGRTLRAMQAPRAAFCLNCGNAFRGPARQRYCSGPCQRRAAYQRRRDEALRLDEEARLRQEEEARAAEELTPIGFADLYRNARGELVIKVAPNDWEADDYPAGTRGFPETRRKPGPLGP
jgi:predicted nucleic acid-binding Zn ribbon protein